MTPDQFEQFMAVVESMAESLRIIREAVEQAREEALQA